MKSDESSPREEVKTKSHGRERDDEYVSDTDVELWAARERAQRRAWVEGPSEEEKREWAARERRRRGSRLGRDEYSRLDRDDYEDVDREGRRIVERWRRDLELVLTGLAARIVEPPYEIIGHLAREGRRYEDELSHVRRRRRRVLTDDDS